MNNTALRAEAQSADNTHMVFANEEHERFYYEKLEQARYQDCYHKALIYIFGISEDTRNHFSQIYEVAVTEVSELYRNKGTNRYYRAYVEVQKANIKEKSN